MGNDVKAHGFPEMFLCSKERIEIFASLSELFENKRYSTFNALSVIQIEGLFNDYLNICQKHV